MPSTSFQIVAPSEPGTWDSMWLIQAAAVVATHGTEEAAKGAMTSSHVRLRHSSASVVSRRMRWSDTATKLAIVAVFFRGVLASIVHG